MTDKPEIYEKSGEVAKFWIILITGLFAIKLIQCTEKISITVRFCIFNGFKILCYFREKQIQAINAFFEACKSRPVHATNKRLQRIEILPLVPDFNRYGI